MRIFSTHGQKMNCDSTMMDIPAHDQAINYDSPMMVFPTRDQFIATYFCQIFTLSDSVIYYILKNPKSSKLYQKMIQTCKYFFIKNPILILHSLQIDDDGWKICSNDCNALSFTKRVNVNGKTLFGCKLWIQNSLQICSSNSNCASDLTFNVYQCDVEKVQLRDQKISLQQFLFFSQRAKSMILQKVVINFDAYSQLPIEEILSFIPNVVRFFFEFGTGMKNVSSDTVTKLLKIPHFKNINFICLLHTSEEFDIDTFYNYYKNRNSKLSFYIRYHNLPSEEYAEKLKKVIHEILDIGMTDWFTSRISYPGQNPAAAKAMVDLYKKSHKYYD